MNKRVLSLLLALVMAFALGAPAFAADEFEAEAPAVREEAPVAPVAEEPEAPVEEPVPAAVEPADEPAPAAAAASGTCGENVTWAYADGTLTISGTGPMKDYYPFSDGEKLQEFAPWAELESDDSLSKNITKIAIESGVTAIGDFAFYCCYYAESVVIPDTVTSIGDYAFESCGLTSVTIPGSVTSIGASAFDRNQSLASVTIGEGVETIGSFAFGYDRELTEVDIPSSVTVIYEGAFMACFFMTDITIRNPQCELAKAVDPDAIDHMGLVSSSEVVTIHGYTGSTAEKYVEEQNKEAAESEYFDGTLPFAFVVIGEEEPKPAPSTSGECGENVTWSLSGDGTLTIAGTGAMDDYESEGDAPWAQSRELFHSIKKVVVESGVTHIGEFAFYDCTTVVSASIAGTVEEIGLNAFGSCTGLESVTIADGVTSIGYNAFMLCEKLKSVDVPASVTSIGVAAFARCNALTDITIRNPECELGQAMAESSHVVTIHGYAGSTAEKFVEEQNKEAEQYGGVPGYAFAEIGAEPEPTPTPEIPAAPKSGTGWVENETTGDIYFYKNNKLVSGYWVGNVDGASKWAGNWYYVGEDGKLATGMQYIDDLHGGMGWYFLQPTNDNGEIGKMLTGWQWVDETYGTCWFSTKSGESGKCTYSSELGDWNGAAWTPQK